LPNSLQAPPDLRAVAPAALDYLIRSCAELHMKQIVMDGDPFERGNARPLDFHHWSAHELEILSVCPLRS
jgi:3-dehydroquinate synthase